MHSYHSGWMLMVDNVADFTPLCCFCPLLGRCSNHFYDLPARLLAVTPSHDHGVMFWVHLVRAQELRVTVTSGPSLLNIHVGAAVWVCPWYPAVCIGTCLIVIHWLGHLCTALYEERTAIHCLWSWTTENRTERHGERWIRTDLHQNFTQKKGWGLGNCAMLVQNLTVVGWPFELRSAPFCRLQIGVESNSFNPQGTVLGDPPLEVLFNPILEVGRFTQRSSIVTGDSFPFFWLRFKTHGIWGIVALLLPWFHYEEVVFFFSQLY